MPYPVIRLSRGEVPWQPLPQALPVMTTLPEQAGPPPQPLAGSPRRVTLAETRCELLASLKPRIRLCCSLGACRRERLARCLRNRPFSRQVDRRVEVLPRRHRAAEVL